MNKLKRWIARLPELFKEWKWLGHYMKRYWLSIGFYIALGLLGVAMGLIVSVAQKNLINAVTAENKILKEIITAASVVISLAVLQIFLNAGSNWISTRINIRVVNEVREDIFKKIIATRWESLVNYHSGDIINRQEGDVSTIAGGIITFVPSLITRLAQFIGAFVIILYHDPTMAIFAFISAPVLLITGRPLMKIMRKHNEKMRDINGRILGFNEEVFQNIQMVKAFDLGATYCKNLRALQAEYKKIRLDYNRVTIGMSILMGFLGLIAGYSCYAWGVYRLYVGAINYGEMTLFISLTGTLSASFSGLVHIIPSAITTATARAGFHRGLPAVFRANTAANEAAVCPDGKAASRGGGISSSTTGWTAKGRMRPTRGLSSILQLTRSSTSPQAIAAPYFRCVRSRSSTAARMIHSSP